MATNEGAPLKLVTRKGECFEIVFQRKEIVHNRDGVFYLFHLNDLTDKNRGKRLVSVFRFGPEEFYGPNYDARLETVLLNTIRRAFDAGRLTFDGPYDPHTYTEILLQPEDFGPQKVASGNEIQDLIKHEAYWLGFRHTPNPGYPVEFDSPTDLEYLGVTPADVRRYVLLLGQRELLDKIMAGLGRPTHKLIDAMESAPKTTEADDSEFARMAIEEAKRSVPEPDGRTHPKVGVVIVKDGRVLAKAHRGEFPKEHAEYVALEEKLADVSVVGATVYATLEPCTTRHHPKVPCAERLAERAVARVFIGMLDPNPDIRGMGQMVLSRAGIDTQFFRGDLMKEVEELNRDFVREQAQKRKSTVDPKVQMILSSKGKIVTVTNRRSNTYWGSDTVVVDCNAVFVTLKNAGSSEPQSFPLTQVDISFDHKNNRLSIDLDRY
jgi:pyrimidine deaminase RibD-like protein